MQKLNSDQLREKLRVNNCAMNMLAEENDRIIKLLHARGLKAIDRDVAPQPEVVSRQIVRHGNDFYWAPGDE